MPKNVKVNEALEDKVDKTFPNTLNLNKRKRRLKEKVEESA